MAATNSALRTNTSPLKRSFDHAALASEPRLHRSCERYGERRSVSVSSASTTCRPRSSTKRRTISNPAGTIMQTPAPSIMSGSFPSFMSVYGNSETKNIYEYAAPENQYHNQTDRDNFSHNPPHSITYTHAASRPAPRSIQRRSSANSTTSFSTASSPTTTNSTFDSPLMAQASGSPSSSPESASSAMPPKSFQSAMPSSTVQMNESSEGQQPVPANSKPLSPTSLDDTRRNVKNLTLDMKLPTLLRSSPTISLDGAAHPFSAPTSPLKEPLRTGRRKPTNLTIRTPGFNELTFGKIPGLVPSTPGLKTSLSQPQPSPRLPPLSSPTTGPAGGMHLALPNIAQHVQNDTTSNNSAPLASGSLSSLPSLREEEYQPPKSQEVQERGYTSGPELIYDSGVYLYLEPTVEEASKFDTVINVAKEIKDPFESADRRTDTVVSVWRNNSFDRKNITEPQTAISEISFKSAFEWPTPVDPRVTTPTTPRPPSNMPLKRPEYLHVRWDHNSEILEDLYPLCQLIDDRVAKGKKVLIHCQLGVSRSASLIIAYGLYKGYEKDFHSMYMSVKKRSQWVGPNMSLIYQLTDFRSRCARGDYVNVKVTANPQWFLHNADNVTTPTAAPILLDNKVEQSGSNKTAMDTHPQGRPPLRLNKDLPPVPLFTGGDQSSTRRLQSSVRSSMIQHPVPFSISTSPTMSQPPKRSASRPLPLREKMHISGHMSIPPHRPSHIPGLTFAQPSSLMDLAMQDVPSTPSLFSPRATEFVASPFGVTTAGDLVSSAPKRMNPPPGAFPGGNEWRQSMQSPIELTREYTQILAHDPRSPPQVGESKEILRNIDDML